MIVTINSSKQYITSVPGLLGFRPEKSIVMSMFRGEQLFLTTRVDADDALHTGYVEQMIEIMGREGGTTVLLACFDPDQERFDKIVEALAHADISIRDALMVDDGKYWSVICDKPQCEECFGTIKESDYETAPMTLGAVTSGMKVAASRDEIVAEIKTAKLGTKAWKEGVDIGKSIKVGAETEQDFLWDAYRYCSQLLDTNIKPEEVCAIAWLVQDERIRDAVMVDLLNHERPFEVSARLASNGLAKVPVSNAAPILALIALGWYVSGDGARTWVALDKSREIDDKYKFTELLQRSLAAGLNPTHIREALGDLEIEVALQASVS